MPAFYAAFFPALSPDADWIYQFREDHDPKSGVVAPHLTLVFPTSLLVADQFVKAVRDACNGLKSFDAEFRAAVFMPERVGQISKASVFLVPDRGFSDIVWLHSKLYSGSLAAAQLFEFPFIPHITIGSGLELRKAKQLSDLLNQKRFEISMLIDGVDIVEIKDESSTRQILTRVEFE